LAVDNEDERPPGGHLTFYGSKRSIGKAVTAGDTSGLTNRCLHSYLGFATHWSAAQLEHTAPQAVAGTSALIQGEVQAGTGASFAQNLPNPFLIEGLGCRAGLDHAWMLSSPGNSHGDQPVRTPEHR
jgi:hypothetical protein